MAAPVNRPPEVTHHAPTHPGADHHNAVLEAARARVDELEPKLAAVLEPILRRAGDAAARRFKQYATNHLTAAGPLTGVKPTSTMICVRPRPEEAAAIADPDGAPASDLHCTLAFLGEIEGPLEAIREALAVVAGQHGPLAGVVAGYGEFRPPDVGILLPDVPGLVELRVAATEALVAAGIDYSRDHGWQPHITVDGDPEDGEIDMMLDRASGRPLHFDALLIVRGDAETFELPLVGPRPLTADGQPPPPDWTPPAADELVDTDALAAALHTKTDPIRLALIQDVLGAVFGEPGVTEEEAIAFYHSPKAFELNEALRSGKQLTVEQQHIVNALDKAMAPSEEDMVLWRGYPDAKAVLGDVADSKFATPGYLSTSETKETAEVFSKGLAGPDDAPFVLRIDVPKGTPMLRVPAGDYGDQQEWLLPRDVKVGITEAVTSDETGGAGLQAVEDLEKLRALPLDMRPRFERGEFTHYDAEERVIRLAPGATEREVVHEIGHWIDHNVLGQDGRMATRAEAPVVQDLMDAIRGSDAWKVWDEGASRSFASDPELFARAYEQWYATRAGDVAGRAAQNALTHRDLPSYWSDSDFKGIAERMDALVKGSVAVPSPERPLRVSVLSHGTLSRSTAGVAQGAGVALSFDVDNPLIDGLIAKTGQHITGIADTTQANVMRAIGSSYQQGLSIPDTAKVITQVMHEAAGPRSIMIARTEMTSAVNGASLAAANLIGQATGKPMTKTWLCVAPWTRISGEGVRAVIRKPYQGDLVTVTARSARGLPGTSPTARQFTVTPDHLVLTGRGWVPAGLLQPGDDVVGRAFCEEDGEAPNVNDVESTAEEIFDAALSAASAVGMVSVPVHLDDGGIGEKIDIQPTDSDLRDRLHAALSEPLRQLMLAVSDVRFDELFCGGSAADRFIGHGPAQPRRVAEPALRHEDAGIALMAHSVGLALAPEVNAVLDENLSDESIGEAEPDAELLHRLAASVGLDEIIQIERRPWAGHVYDLTTLSGWFFADGYVAHNTAPGARYPRHEEYDGLDGQTVGQNEEFEVGDAQLLYPGDPDGDPGETINCRPRCAMTYSDGSEVEAE